MDVTYPRNNLDFNTSVPETPDLVPLHTDINSDNSQWFTSLGVGSGL
jgi:hypothetical protein